jgi:quercetin dioxygenase-like cupin family protein
MTSSGPRIRNSIPQRPLSRLSTPDRIFSPESGRKRDRPAEQEQEVIVIIPRPRRLVAVLCTAIGLAVFTGGGYAAYKATITQVNPSTVPPGFLAARGYIPFKVALQIGSAKPHVFADGVQAYIQHGLIQPGQSTGWHSHAGPVWVLMVNGALTLYSGTDKTCTGHTYQAGQGFVDIGFGHIHIARNEGTTPAEFYAFYMLPNQSGDAGVKLPQADFTNPACAFTP